MEKFQTDSKTDIADEPYKGPGPFVVSAGYVYITHLISTIAGAVALGAVGYFAATKTVAVKDAFTRIGNEYGSSTNWLKKVPGSIIGFVPKFSEWMVSHIPGAKRISGHTALEEKNTAVVFAAGIGAFSGWLASTVWGIAKGGHQSNQGKQQHNQLVAALKNERERNDDLEKINDELHAKYVAAATQKEEASEQSAASEKLADTNEAPHQHAAAEAEADVAPTHHHHETPEHSIHTQGAHAEHHGKIHAHASHEHAAHAHA
jgi:hypothetical protein